MMHRLANFKFRLLSLNPLNAKLNPIIHLLALLGAHHILHVRIRVNIYSRVSRVKNSNLLLYMTNCVQAMIVICSDRGWLNTALQAQLLLQMLVVGSWGDGNAPFLMLPGVTRHNLKFLLSGGQRAVRCVPELQSLYCNKYTALVAALRDHFQLQQIKEVSDSMCIKLTVNTVLGLVVVVLTEDVQDLTNNWGNTVTTCIGTNH